MVKQRKRILENFCGIHYLMCSMIKKEQQNFYTVNVIETKRSDYKRLSKSRILVGKVKKTDKK